ncbi:MAG: hypothetical protein DRQ56_04315 [Gammaproteobacteria bacterium]|nr:MAG: hypothetical protein DRQ56_04315 [Gammaproteobacteria bacterium]
MATTGKFKANLMGIYVGTDLIAGSTSSTFSGSNGTIDATSKENDGAKQILLGQQEWSMNHDGHLEFDAAYGLVDLLTAWKAKTTLTLKFSTEVSGDTYLTGDALITSVDLSAEVNGVTAGSVSFEGTGVITIDTVT